MDKRVSSIESLINLRFHVLSMLTYVELLKKLKEIKSSGWVKTHRTGNTGIGKTIEDLLGIKENNVPGPDAEKLELKSARKNAKSMLTLFTKSPLPPKANAVILARFGYAAENGRKELHTTLNAISHNLLRGCTGLKIKVDHSRIEIITENSEVLGYWDKDTLKKTFERKLPRLMYIKAESQGSGKNEEFWFNEAWLLQGFDFENFLKLLTAGVILVDIRIGQYPNGKPHDHGTGFRIQPNQLELCFSKREQIL